MFESINEEGNKKRKLFRIKYDWFLLKRKIPLLQMMQNQKQKIASKKEEKTMLEIWMVFYLQISTYYTRELRNNNNNNSSKTRRPSPPTKADSLGVDKLLPTVLQIVLQSLDLARHERFMRSMPAKAMSCVLFNYMEPNGFSPAQFVNFRPKCILGAWAPKQSWRSTQNRLNQIEEK